MSKSKLRRLSLTFHATWNHTKYFYRSVTGRFNLSFAKFAKFPAVKKEVITVMGRDRIPIVNSLRSVIHLTPSYEHYENIYTNSQNIHLLN